MPFFKINRETDADRLHYIEAGAGFPLLLLHGFTGSSANWQPILPALAEKFRVIAPDLPGHGQTRVNGPFTMAATAGLLADLLDHLSITQTHLLGYSMGGRLALYCGAHWPDRVRALVLESASPGLKTTPERAERKARDDALADRIERQGIIWFVDHWEQLPLWNSQKRLPHTVRQQQRDRRLQNDPAGLARSLRDMGTGVQPSLWDALPELALPVHLIVGAEDDKFLGIAQEMTALLPDARFVRVADAGHTVHLEQPRYYTRTVAAFLEHITDE